MPHFGQTMQQFATRLQRNCTTFAADFLRLQQRLMNEKKSIREKVGYSLGDVAANLMFQILALLLMKLVADHFGLHTAIYSKILNNIFQRHT